MALAAWLGWFALGRRGYARSGCVCLLLCGLALGGAWRHVCWNWFGPDDLGLYASYEPQPICLRAVAIEAPRRVAPRPFDPLRAIPSGQHSRLAVRAEAVRAGRDWQPASGQATLEIDGQLVDIEAGDRLQLSRRSRRRSLRSMPANSIMPSNCVAIANSADCGATVRRKLS